MVSSRHNARASNNSSRPRPPGHAYPSHHNGHHHRPSNGAARSHHHRSSRGAGHHELSRNIPAHHQDYHLRYKFVPEDSESIISPCVKYSLFFFNFVFWLIGTTMIGLGAWSFAEEVQESGYTRFLQVNNVVHLMLHVSLAMMIIGGITFLMSFAGCLGALRENICLLKVYSFMLLFLFIGEVVLSTVAFVFPNTFLQYFKQSLSKDLIMKYRDDANLKNIIDSIQTNLRCCGLSDNGYKDWNQNMYFNCSEANKSYETCSVPTSCCREFENGGLYNERCGTNVKIQSIISVVEVNKSIYTRGCIEAFTEIFEKNMNFAACLCLSCAMIQLFAMFLARSLQGQIYTQLSRWM